MSFRVPPTPESFAGATAWRQWLLLSEADRARYTNLRTQFQSRVDVHERRSTCVARELRTLLGFIDTEPLGFENRCILAGVVFAGRLICVNTRQLSKVLGRSKTSLNAALLDLGYSAMDSRAQVRDCILRLLPSMAKEPESLRQWSVRVASEDALCRFLPNFGPQTRTDRDDLEKWEIEASGPEVDLAEFSDF
jgi:hypothetical protein